MKRNRLLTLTLTLTLLTGCASGGGTAAVEQLRQWYQDQPQITAQAEVLADYGTCAYAYTVNLSGGEESGSLTVLAPESIAGTGTAWEAGKTSLDYEGIRLETGPLTPEGLSPAEGIPTLLYLLRCGAASEWGWERWGEGKRCLCLVLDHPELEQLHGTIRGDPETGQLLSAELYWQENRVLSFTFSDYVIQ